MTAAEIPLFALLMFAIVGVSIWFGWLLRSRRDD